MLIKGVEFVIIQPSSAKNGRYLRASIGSLDNMISTFPKTHDVLNFFKKIDFFMLSSETFKLLWYFTHYCVRWGITMDS